jgi:hypothetical protein
VGAGVLVGWAVGALVGVLVGALVGVLVGALVGVLVGAFVGALVGSFVGALVGALVGVVLLQAANAITIIHASKNNNPLFFIKLSSFNLNVKFIPELIVTDTNP